MPSSPLIALLTDFGTADGYAGVVKGVLLQRCPHARIVDIAHDIAPQSIDSAAFVLWNTHRWFPDATVFLAVVDPGVGTSRGILAAWLPNGQQFVAPDNGLLRFILADYPDAIAVDASDPPLRLGTPSATFHARDVMAPIAAALASGTPLEALGPLVHTAHRAQHIRAQIAPAARRAAASVLHIDHFGTIITNVACDIRVASLSLNGKRVRRECGTYAACPDGRLCFLKGSSGFWEIAMRNGSAQRILEARTGDKVSVRCRTEEGR
ncbi:SAM-dependent chlorinase/fluorinase [bacterium]|nr:SAM-dependent chlorinase/fluorinase [bacterium]